LAAEVRCPRCGAANRPETAFCVNCGSPLAAGGAGTGVMPSYPAPAYAQGFASPYDQERQKQIDRTKTGVFLLLLGALIGAIPFIGGLGTLLILIGAIFVILGRKAFGTAHSRNVLISIVLFFLGIIIAVAGAVFAFASLVTSFSQTPSPAAFQAAMSNLLIVIAIGTIVGGLASVFFTFALQNQTGKILLLAAYVASVVISIAIFAVLTGAISEFVAVACPTGTTCDQTAMLNAQLAFQGRVTTLGYLQAIPSLLYAGANYLVWNRIKKGEIPGPTTMPGMAAQPVSPIQPR
jgi:MFS family permease